jgi:nicotinamide-nucleotide amidase
MCPRPECSSGLIVGYSEVPLSSDGPIDPSDQNSAMRLMQCLKGRGMMMATAESCTGGLIAALMTELPGSSAVFDRGFVTYSNAAKVAMLGVAAECLDRHGAVSRETALAMAEGALKHSQAGLALAVTGIAGPGGGTEQKPVGLVHLAAAIGTIGGSLTATRHVECRFGDIGRTQIRQASVRRALELALALVEPR